MTRTMTRIAFWTGASVIVFYGPYLVTGLLGLPSN